MRRSSSAAASSAVRRVVTAASSAARCSSTSAPISASCSRTRAAWASSWSGSRPESTESSAAPAALRIRSPASDWVPRSRSLSPDRANHVSWAADSAGQVLAQRGLELGLALAAAGQLGLDLLAALDQHGLVGHLLLERGAGGDQVVGDQAGAGVAHVGLHGGGLAGDLGLATERLELAPDLAEQVVEAGQVAVGGVELAERLLLALAVLEDAGGLLDEAAPVLRRRVQDRVELALADDDVHLAADAGVAQQLLDVEQAARAAVDGVLRAAVAEHRAADRDLGVVDRQRPVGVVDRQLHLGAAQRRATGRAGEDDVLHLAAAQRLGALLAHHPGERVDDVGLARAVGPDDAGDAGLELQRRGGREGLEALERQALEVQRAPLALGVGAVGWFGDRGILSDTGGSDGHLTLRVVRRPAADLDLRHPHLSQ